MNFRTLRADEIDCRIATISEKGCSILLYKDARCDMNILDEEVGCTNWQRSHSRENANCTVSIWDKEKQMWISKEDTGTESFTEKEKGLASDSFKRACFNWGIGRELYTAPFIWISKEKCKIEKKQGGNGYTCKDKFSVQEIGYDNNRCINNLVICKGDTIVWSTNNKKKSKEAQTDNNMNLQLEVEKATEPQKKVIKDICEKHSIDANNWLKKNGATWDSLTAENAGKMLCALKERYGDE